MSLAPVRVLARPQVDLEFTYRGFIASSVTGLPITGGLTGVSAQASLDGAAYSSTGVTFAEEGQTGWFTLTVGATQMGATYGTVRITVTNDNAETWYLDFRTDGTRLRTYGIPRSVEDAEAGGECAATGLLCPASYLKEMDGLRVVKGWKGGID